VHVIKHTRRMQSNTQSACNQIHKVHAIKYTKCIQSNTHKYTVYSINLNTQCIQSNAQSVFNQIQVNLSAFNQNRLHPCVYLIEYTVYSIKYTKCIQSNTHKYTVHSINLNTQCIQSNTQSAFNQIQSKQSAFNQNRLHPSLFLPVFNGLSTGVQGEGGGGGGGDRGWKKSLCLCC